MKTTLQVALTAALAAACSLGFAGTLSGATSTLNGTSAVTNPPKITAAGQIIQIKHSFGVLYYGPDKNPAFACNAKLEYSDGAAPEMVAVKYPAEGVARMRQYTKPGKYTVSLSGMAHNGMVGCLGSAASTFTIEDGLPAPAKKGANSAAAVMVRPARHPPTVPSSPRSRPSRRPTPGTSRCTAPVMLRANTTYGRGSCRR